MSLTDKISGIRVFARPALIVVLFVWGVIELNIADRKRRKAMTPEERAKEDAEIKRDHDGW